MPKELTDTQINYVRRIKEELNEVLISSKYTYSQLQELLEERYDFSINKGTLKELFNADNPNINYACLITTCTFFGLNLQKLLTPETISDNNCYYVNTNTQKKRKTTTTHPFLESIKSSSNKFTVLRDEGYMGTFKGFIVVPTKSDTVEEFNLTLYKDEDGIAHAKLIRKSAIKSKSTCYEYAGIPYHSKAYQSILIFLTDTKAKGEFYFLSFGFQQYRSEKGLMFRQGFAITGESLRSGSMVAQNFVLFNKELTPENLKYVPGLLKIPVNEFCVPVETAKKLADEYPEVQLLFDKLSGIITQTQEQVYILNEASILSLRSDLSPYDRIKALLLLKGKALVPEKNYYVADSKFSGFAKNFLLEESE